MTLQELNEAAKFNFNDGLTVYLDKQNKTFRFATDKETEKFERRGLTHTISSKEDYKKLARKYNIDISLEDFTKLSNDAKRENDDTDFRRALAAMQQDVMKISRDKHKK